MDVAAVQTRSGANNDSLVLPASSTGTHWPRPAIGVVRISDSHAHVLAPALGADIEIAISTDGGAEGTLIGDVAGTYQGQPINGRLTGGALLSLRDPANPYPVDIRLASGQSRISLVGTVSDPFHPQGADLKLELSGQDMASLYPLTGVASPPTPPFSLTSSVAYAGGLLHLANIAGRLGSSDLNGELSVDTRPARPVITGSVWSRRADLEDFIGLIGSQPGRMSTPDQTPAQQRAVAQAIANPRLIPNVPMDLSKIRSADFHIAYRGDSIVGRSVPFDTIATRLDIEDGHIRATDFRVGVGRGQALGQIDMTPVQDSMHTVADIKLQSLDVGRLLAATHLIHGSGVLGGEAQIDSTGKSLSDILVHGNGHLSLFMAGGNVSELIVDLSGLQIGNAALSALGFPDRAQIRCLVGDVVLTKGVLRTRTLMLDTTDHRTTVQGSVDLRTETIAAQLRTQAKHFTIGTLAAPIAITGTLKDPRFAPGAAELGARGAGALGLGLLFPPAALLPTIQLGIGEDNACVSLVREGAAHPGAPTATKPPPARPSAR
nr:AsmA family protein [Limobrevibacterium gyesilva]